MLVVYCVVMRCLSMMMWSHEMFWVSSHMVNICSMTFLKLVYARSSRRRFMAVWECITRVGNPGHVGAWWLLFVCCDQVDLVHHWNFGGIFVVRVDCVHV